MDTTNPFRTRPAKLARLPRVVRLYMFHSLIGFALSGLFTGAVVWVNIANIGHLVANVSGGYIALFVFFMLNGIVFAGVQTAIAVMSMSYDDTPKPPRGPKVGVTGAIPVVTSGAGSRPK